MGQMGRITTLSDLPPDEVLRGYIKEAVRLNEGRRQSAASDPDASKKKADHSRRSQRGLKKKKQALAAFENFSPSHKREYVEWITEAKREETRARRLRTALEWLAKGKSLNWKYEELLNGFSLKRGIYSARLPFGRNVARIDSAPRFNSRNLSRPGWSAILAPWIRDSEGI